MDEMSAKEYVTLQTLMESGKDVDEALAEVRKRYAPLPEEPSPKRKSKYGNHKVTLDGYTFDSKREAARYGVLKLMEQQGEIEGLEVHPVFHIVHNDMNICRYEGDFLYIDTDTGEEVLEDVKSPATQKNPVYRLKKKLVKAFHNLDITEVM